MNIRYSEIPDYIKIYHHLRTGNSHRSTVVGRKKYRIEPIANWISHGSFLYRGHTLTVTGALKTAQPLLCEHLQLQIMEMFSEISL